MKSPDIVGNALAPLTLRDDQHADFAVMGLARDLDHCVSKQMAWVRLIELIIGKNVDLTSDRCHAFMVGLHRFNVFVHSCAVWQCRRGGCGNRRYCLCRTSGTYRLDGENIESLSDNQLADIRCRKIGFVFQMFNLLPRSSALDNVMLPLTYGGVHGRQRWVRVEEALARVQLADRMHHRPNELSGGEQQRVAIARALVNDAAILLADEPTGALDSKTGAESIGLFQRLHRELGQTVIHVTHELFIARHTERVVRLADGKIVDDGTILQPLVAGTPRPSELALAGEAQPEPTSNVVFAGSRPTVP